jgi:DEAD/DEAH box helicase/Helicase conserved C-terminal domain/Domain of unknown function (DUF1998)
MKQYNLAKLVSGAESSLVSYLASALPVGNHRNQHKLGERFFTLWHSQTFKGPYLESIPQYQKGKSLSELAGLPVFSSPKDRTFFSLMHPLHDWKSLESAISLKRFIRPRRQLWKEGTTEGAAEMEKTTLQQLWERPLYSHQAKSFETIARRGANAIVATGTGSGKTECFLLPLLYELLGEDESVRLRPGVRAILLYPMNALVEDQMARLRRLLFWINLRAYDSTSPNVKLARPISFGRYTGETKVDENDRGLDRSVSEEEVHEIGELRYRKEMQQTPPDILVTNFTMLEYMLLRNDDQRLFREPTLFKFLILDEVHSYRGTTGMEVSTLLRRFRNYLTRASVNGASSYRCVGTSATLGSESSGFEKMADFATRLFGTQFSKEQIIVGDFRSTISRESQNQFDALTVLTDVLSIAGKCPILSAAFAIDELTFNEDAGVEIPAEEWSHLAHAIGSHSVDLPALLTSGLERTELLGRFVAGSSVFVRLQSSLAGVENGVANVLLLSNIYWGKDLTANRRDDCLFALGRLFQIINAARLHGNALLSVRAHLFVREHRHAYLCIDQSHKGGGGAKTDGWWSELFVHHRNNCDTCQSIVYPLFLCRKCGFVVLEGWFRKKTSCIAPERDELLGKGQFRRILFRPANALSERLRDRLLSESKVILVSICTSCGLRFPHDNKEYLQAAVEAHSKCCPATSIVELVEWSESANDISLRECPYCEQEWFSEQEVITPPMLSLYSATTILLEEMKRAIDEPLQGTSSVNKVLCFSDSRQQAAFIASRIQKTNEDFTFRQIIYSALEHSTEPMSTKRLIAQISDIVADDRSLAQLFCEPEEVSDETQVRKRVATLLFRDTCTEYRTLESVGLVSVLLPAKLVSQSDDFLRGYPFTRRFDENERTSYTQFLFDWIFRFHRWAMSPGPVQLFYSDLERYGYQDRSISRLAGDQYSRTSGFSLKQENSRNRIFDFYKRLCKRESRPLFSGDLSSFKHFLESMWDFLVATPELYSRQKQGVPQIDDKPFIAVAGTDAQSLQLKINWLALRWKLENDSFRAFRCDCCGFITRGNVRGICPIRDCSGTLDETTLQQISQETFSPARHYMMLLKTKSPKSLIVEEHTAQISPMARRQIEESFKNDEKGSVDIISGSTTFELGIDLGIVNGVFLANMPPDVSNYRQRAGRAGRRTGMMPIVFTYVRERPHDSYFWSKPEYFIAGPLRVPRFSVPSHEVLLRHVNATVYSFLMQTYPTPTGLQGPTVGDFLTFAFQTTREVSLRQQAKNPASDLFKSLKSVLAANSTLTMSPDDSLDRFYKRLRHFQETYSVLVNNDGVISAFSDYGILPSYNYPIYVDELRLYECPRTEWPRKDLKLQRDRSISLNEYFPGRIIVAGKVPIRSTGLWKGFKFQPFKYCKECAYIDTQDTKTSPESCPNGCGSLVSLRAVRPLGGFIGKVERGLARQDPELFSIARSQFLFDPAGNPPSPLTASGLAVNAAKQTSFNIEKSGARMRIFVPRPDGEQSLELGKSQIRDVAMPGREMAECLVLPSDSNGPREKCFMMHEFTTDILRIQIRNNEVGKALRCSPAYLAAATSDDEAEKRKANTVWLWTLTQAFAIGGARLLQIDSREIAFTFRCAPSDALLKREAILFDTAPGGAGYCDQLYEDLRALFQSAADVLDCREECGDSCYACLRSFDNQTIHSRLNRYFVLEGLKKFVRLNWS